MFHILHILLRTILLSSIESILSKSIDTVSTLTLTAWHAYWFHILIGGQLLRGLLEEQL